MQKKLALTNLELHFLNKNNQRYFLTTMFLHVKNIFITYYIRRINIMLMEKKKRKKFAKKYNILNFLNIFAKHESIKNLLQNFVLKSISIDLGYSCIILSFL